MELKKMIYHNLLEIFNEDLEEMNEEYTKNQISFEMYDKKMNERTNKFIKEIKEMHLSNEEELKKKYSSFATEKKWNFFDKIIL